MAGIINSAQAPDYTAQAQKLYADMGRAGEAGGVDYWAGQLASGKSLGDVTTDFKNSARTTVMNDLTGKTAANPVLNSLYTGIGNGLQGQDVGQERFMAQLDLKPQTYDYLYG